jgi:signal transduction histidine kinase
VLPAVFDMLSLMEMQGGRIEARSAGPGQGSEFVVRLPKLAAGERP